MFRGEARIPLEDVDFPVRPLIEEKETDRWGVLSARRVPGP